MIEGQMDTWEVIDLVETPYFDGEGNEGTIDEVYS
jgi:hypothetical protein